MSALTEMIVSVPGIIFLVLNAVFFFTAITYKKLDLKKNMPTKLPKVSLIIAAWNEGPRIERCINSILKMNYPRKNLEIIVVGGGTDNTSEVCKKLYKKGLITYIEEKERHGKWYALNSAINRAHYDYLAFTDADCVVSRDWLRSLVAHSKNADIVASTVNALHDDEIVGKCYSVSGAYLGLVGYGLAKVFNASTYSGVGSFMRKSIAKEIKFPKSFVEDYRFCFMALKKGYKLKIALESPVYQSRPKSFGDWRKCYLRLYNGMLSEMIALKDPFAILTVVIGFLSLIGLVVGLTTATYVGPIIISINIANAIFSLLNISLIPRIFKLKNQFPRIPYLLIYFYFAQLVGVESFFRWLFKRNIGWPTYNKV